MKCALYTFIVLLFCCVLSGCKKNESASWSESTEFFGPPYGGGTVGGNGINATFGLQSERLTITLTGASPYPSISLQTCCDLVYSGAYDTNNGFFASYSADADTVYNTDGPNGDGNLYLMVDASGKTVSGNFAFYAGLNNGNQVGVTKGVFSQVPITIQ